MRSIGAEEWNRLVRETSTFMDDLGRRGGERTANGWDDAEPFVLGQSAAIAAGVEPASRGCILDHSHEDRQIARWCGREALRRGKR